MLDGLILWGEAARLGAQTEAGWYPEELAIALPLPLAKVTLPDTRWWYACSGAIPGTDTRHQDVRHINKRADIEAYLRWTTAKAVDERAGPDAQRRRPRYYFPFWTRLEWTCIGDKDAIRRALAYVHGIGQGVPQGQGTVRWPDGWQVEDDPNGPTLDEYRTNARLRPLPADVCASIPPRAIRCQIPLRAPYWCRTDMHDCYKVSENHE